MPEQKQRLRHSADSEPGYTRKRIGRYWAYYDEHGKRITDRDEIERLNAIGLPPAYEQAWFSPDPQGHILATGIDARGRKQYRYHPGFRLHREGAKFDATARFGRLLPKVRKRVEADLGMRALCRDRAVASVVRLLDTGTIRVGNEAYAKANRSFGATTLRMRHARLAGKTLRLRFKAKSGKLRDMTLTDRALLRFVRAMQDLPGQHLFQYLDEEGSACPVTSTDVNAWLKETMGEDFTAKHFRTWGASVLAYAALAHGRGEGVPLKAMLELVADALGNTPAISRKSYVHPKLLDAVKDDPRDPLAGMERPRARKRLSTTEVALLEFLARGGKRRRKRTAVAA